MKKIIIAPDKFKGTVSASKICDIVEEAFFQEFGDIEIIKMPVADGGDGTAECFMTQKEAKKYQCEVYNPFYEKIVSYFVMVGDTAIVEMALCAGLSLVEERKNPLITTTYGVGQTAMCAIASGAKKIVFALGGSATNDMACGLLCAMGMKFYDEMGKAFIPCGATLLDIANFDTKELDEIIKNVEFEIMCDINNILYGANGAAYVFAPQKGADEKAVEKLDAGLKHLADLIYQKYEKDVSSIPGAGAAGGMGAGLYAFLNGKVKSGVDVVLETCKFNEKLKDCDLVITGEGKLDTQTLSGKVICGIAKICKKENVPLIAVCGDTFSCPDEIYSIGVTSAFSINSSPLDFEKAKSHSEQNLFKTAQNIAKLLNSFGN